MPTWTWPASAPVRVPRACARCAGPRWKKVADGVTTIEEVRAVLPPRE
jgi:primosomal protein N'